MSDTRDTQNDISRSSSFESLDLPEREVKRTEIDSEKGQNVASSSDIESDMASLSMINATTDKQNRTIPFESNHCLFCSQDSTHFESNLSHMSKAHGLFIPSPSNLLVDIGTLIEYLHLVIFTYHECLYCGSQRHSAQAAQQHMTGKGHCKIDISNVDSEFKDFWDFESGSDGEGDDGDSKRASKVDTHAIVVENIMRLPSGKLLSHRAEGNVKRRQQHRPAPTSPSPSLNISTINSNTPNIPFTNSEANKVVKREAIFDTRLAKMRVGDRMSLMHLTRTQQKAVLVQGRKMVERARKEENDMMIKRQIKANR